MTFRSRNAYYLRISSNIVLPLFLYLDERHVDWMSDVTLQHVLADLRLLIIPKLQAEKDVHFGPGTTPGNRRGTVEVHRGETYQFAYFFRKTEPHTVLFKSRHFVTAPVPPEVTPKPASSRPADWDIQKKRSRTQTSTKQSKRKRAKTSEGKSKNSKSLLDGDEWPAEESESEDDMDIINDDDDVSISLRSPKADGGSYEHPRVQIKSSTIADDRDVIACDESNQPSLSSDTVDVELVVEEEEKKPKPLLKLKYQSFPITGHCLCAVVEPWPPLHTETRLQPVGLGASVRRSGLEPPPRLSTMGEQREKTPLFFPEYGRAPSEVPFAGERNLPPVPLFHDAMPTTEHNSYDDDLINFSQTLNPAGHMHALAADDDDDMDGAVLFGDADEVRELF